MLFCQNKQYKLLNNLDNRFIIRKITKADIDSGLRLSMAEGWNQTASDWAFLTESTNTENKLFEYKSSVIATTTVLNYTEMAWIGMVLVDSDFRGKGISKLLLNAVFEKADNFKSIKLDATPAGRNVYEKFGFQDEFLIDRMTSFSENYNLENEIDSLYLEPYADKYFDEIVDLDKTVFGVNRKNLIEYLITGNYENSWIYREENTIKGFVLGRKGQNYFQIGPVVANSDSNAKILISKALKNTKNKPIVIDILQSKSLIINWLNSINFTKQRHFIRMYKNENIIPECPYNLFAIAGPELG